VDQDTQLVEAYELPTVKRLDGEVTKVGVLAFAGGTSCEVWVGQWEKCGGGEIGGERVDVEKVSLSLSIPFTLLT